MMKICPQCGAVMREAWGLGGTAPNYHKVKIWYCNTGWLRCELGGFGLTEETLGDSAKLARLVENQTFIKHLRKAARHEP